MNIIIEFVVGFIAGFFITTLIFKIFNRNGKKD